MGKTTAVQTVFKKKNLELDLRAQTFDEGSVYFAVSSRYLKNNNCFCFKSFL
jgi:hypothetical protein